MKQKKIWPIRKKEILTEGLHGICLIVAGLVAMFFKENFYTIVIMVAVLIGLLVSIIIRKIKSEPWDEMAREHYSDARRIIMCFEELILLILALGLIISKSSITINHSSIFFIVGLIKLLQTMVFISIDRKNIPSEE